MRDKHEATNGATSVRLMDRLRDSIEAVDGAAGRTGHDRWKKRTIQLFLGNDREIGRNLHSQERRVGIAPAQVGELIATFRSLGIRLDVLVHENAGVRAGFANADYVHAGAEIVTPAELDFLDGAPDVVHALKEPSIYEARIPGPFCRIGALHPGDFHQASGFAALVRKGDVTIFDGSSIGAPACRRVPIRGRMSEFAGDIAGEWIDHHARGTGSSGHVVVVGAGRVGRGAVRRLLQCDRVTHVTLFEDASDDAAMGSVRSEWSAEARVHVRPLRGLDQPDLCAELRDAIGVVFAVAKPDSRAPKVIAASTLEGHLPPGGMIVDVCIDERGAIHDEDVDPGATAEGLIPYFERRFARHVYRAAVNMPRERPGAASLAHGEVVLPYVATLLYLAAREGGAAGAVQTIASLPSRPDCPDPAEADLPDVLGATLQDLRNGLAVEAVLGEEERCVVLHNILPSADRAAILSMLDGSGVRVRRPEYSLA